MNENANCCFVIFVKIFSFLINCFPITIYPRRKIDNCSAYFHFHMFVAIFILPIRNFCSSRCYWRSDTSLALLLGFPPSDSLDLKVIWKEMGKKRGVEVIQIKVCSLSFSLHLSLQLILLSPVRTLLSLSLFSSFSYYFTLLLTLTPSQFTHLHTHTHSLSLSHTHAMHLSPLFVVILIFISGCRESQCDERRLGVNL